MILAITARLNNTHLTICIHCNYEQKPYICCCLLLLLMWHKQKMLCTIIPAP